MQRPHVLRGGADPSLALPTARPLPPLGPRGGVEAGSRSGQSRGRRTRVPLPLWAGASSRGSRPACSPSSFDVSHPPAPAPHQLIPGGREVRS